MKRKEGSLVLGISTVIVSLFMVIYATNGGTFEDLTYSSVFGFGAAVMAVSLPIFSLLIIRDILMYTVDKEINRRKYSDGSMKVTFCPLCGSSKISTWSWPPYPIYRCKRCGYRGGIIVEDGLLAQKVQNSYLNQ